MVRNQERVYTFERVAALPLILNVALSETDIRQEQLAQGEHVYGAASHQLSSLVRNLVRPGRQGSFGKT